MSIFVENKIWLLLLLFRVSLDTHRGISLESVPLLFPLMSGQEKAKRDPREDEHPIFTPSLPSPLNPLWFFFVCMVHAAWDLSNEILLAGESRLTYFTVRNTLRLQMKQKKKCFFALHRTKSFPFYMALIKPSGEWHFPGPTVKHGLLHMQTNTHGQNACKCLDPRSSLFLSHSHLCPLIFWSKSKFFFLHGIKFCLLHATTAYYNSSKLLWL